MTDINTTWKQAIAILAKRGGRFVVVSRATKRPVEREWNRTENTYEAWLTETPLRMHANIGLACGTGNLYLLDFDSNAERGHECAQLAGGMYFYRDNAPERAKFVFTCPEPLTTRHANEHGVELLGFNRNGTHCQGVIAGIHPTGATIQWGGHSIPELSKETVEALWMEWTGEELYPVRRVKESDVVVVYENDVEEVRRALSYIPPRGNYTEHWLKVLMAVHSAYPNETGIALCEEWSEGGPGEVAYKFSGFESNGVGLGTLFFMAKQHGYRQAFVPNETVRESYANVKGFLDSWDCVTWLKSKGVRRVPQYTLMLRILVDKAAERGSSQIFYPYRDLATAIGVTATSVFRTINKMVEVGIINKVDTEKGQTLDLSPLLDEPTVTEYLQYTNGSTTVTVGSSDFVLQHASDDAFAVYPYWVAVKRRGGEAPLLSSLGATGLELWRYLVDGGTIKELAAASGYSVPCVRACVKKFVAADLLDVDDSDKEIAYVLKENAEDLLDNARPHMVTHHVGQLRTARNAHEVADYAAFRLRQRKHMTPRDIMWWENLRDDKDRVATLILDQLAEQGFDGRMKVGKEKAVRSRRRYDFVEEWRTWGRPLFDAYNALGNAHQDEKVRLLTVADVGEADKELFHMAYVSMRDKVEMMLMMSRKRVQYERGMTNTVQEELLPTEPHNKLQPQLELI